MISVGIFTLLTTRSQFWTTGNKKNTFIQILERQFSSEKEHCITLLIIILSTELSVYQFIAV
jgi:hypothetical protein